jgi:hypothetical protein
VSQDIATGVIATVGGLVCIILGWLYRYHSQAVDRFWMRINPKGWLRGTTRTRGRMFLAIGTVLLLLGIVQLLIADK